ncbi:hypothetical protein AHF37_12021 [Paragonimus kellicotti]|nr:hypothetical protein AHF37_12021 [Paragonimus kellicotti]
MDANDTGDNTERPLFQMPLTLKMMISDVTL